ncbi:transposase [Proteus mirabilis]|nr:transposase [Proteus mirabilis]
MRRQLEYKQLWRGGQVLAIPPAYTSQKCACDFDVELVEMDGERDHVHLLINYPPKLAISNLVNSLKGVSYISM